jgi:hypothetical protein
MEEGMKNTLEDLNNHLFETMEFLTDRSIEGEKLDTEIKRAETIVEVAKTVISNAQTVVSAYKTADEMQNSMPGWISGKKQIAEPPMRDANERKKLLAAPKGKR